MTGAKLREAMDLLRNLKQQYPAESDELLQQRLREKLGCDPAMRRAIIRGYLDWLQQITERRRTRLSRVRLISRVHRDRAPLPGVLSLRLP